MTLIYLLIATVLLLASCVLLRKTVAKYNYLALVLIVAATLVLISVYGIIGGIFIAVAGFMLAGLLTALALGKAQH